MSVFIFFIFTAIHISCSSEYAKQCPSGAAECVGYNFGLAYQTLKHGFDRAINGD